MVPNTNYHYEREILETTQNSLEIFHSIQIVNKNNKILSCSQNEVVPRKPFIAPSLLIGKMGRY